MPSTYSSRLRLELIADGEQAGIWGQSTNRNLGTLIETAIAGYRTIALLDANYTLTASNGLDDEARYAMLNFTGTLTATREVVVPAVSKLYVLKNQTNQTLNVKTSGGSARAVPAGKTVYLFVDGTNTFDSLNDLTSLSVSGTTTLGVASATNLSYTGTLTGGTGVVNIGSGQLYKDAAGAFGFGTTSTLGFRGVFAESAGNSLALLKPTATLTTESVRLRYYSANTTDGGTYDLGGIDYLREDGGFGVRSSMVVTLKSAGSSGGQFEAFRVTPQGNFGLGATPSGWVSFKAFDINTYGSVAAATNRISLAANSYFDGSVYRYKTTGQASRFDQIGGESQWFTAPSGTAGNPITYTQAMALTLGGNLVVGTATDNGQRAQVCGPSLGGSRALLRLDGNDGVGGGGRTTYISFAGTSNDTGPVQTEFGYIGAAKENGTQGNIQGYLVGAVNTGSGLAEGFRLTSSRFLKVSNTGSYGGVAGIADQSTSASHIFQSNGDINTLSIINGNTGVAVRGVTTALATGAAGLHYDALLNGTTVMRVLANGNIQNTNNSYGAISDAKLKENVTDAPSYLQKFMQVRFRKYNMIGSDLVQFGVVAQELETIFPGLVDTTPDFEQAEVLDQETGQTRTESVALGTVTKSVKYSVLAAMQGKVIQEQQRIIQAQQAQIENILTRLAALEGRRNG